MHVPSIFLAAAGTALVACYLITPGDTPPVWFLGLLQRGLLGLELALIAAMAVVRPGSPNDWPTAWPDADMTCTCCARRWQGRPRRAAAQYASTA